VQNEKGEEEEKEMYQLLMIRANTCTQCSLRIIKLGELFDSRSVSNLLRSSNIPHLVIVSDFEIVPLSLLDHSFVFHELMGFGVSAQRRAAPVRVGSSTVESLVLVGTKYS
jgi:hypothetical protein|tara:strand:- start:49 stop:381 length:333 start_codon:yes stop_codon:yes gene_type:complete